MIDEAYCRSLAHRFFVVGMDRDDLMQEARLAMLMNTTHPYRAAKLRILDLVKIGQRRRFETIGQREPHAAEVDWDARARLREILSLPCSAAERCALARRINRDPLVEARRGVRRDRSIEQAWWRLQNRATLQC